jgi:hypothetical protein
MKLLAQSLVPVNPVPYVHLGYTSAIVNQRQVTSPAGAIVALQCGLFLALLGLVLMAQFGNMTVPRRRLAITSVLIGAVLAVGGLLSFKNQGYTYPIAATIDHGLYIVRRLENQQKSDETAVVPQMSSQLARQPMPDGDSWTEYKLRDAWGQEFRLQRVKHPEYSLIAVSAGPDGQFGSADDIQITQLTPYPYPPKR